MSDLAITRLYIDGVGRRR